MTTNGPRHWVSTRLIPGLEDAGLLLILLAILASGLESVWGMLIARHIDLADLLLLFIYLELVTMVRMYWSSRKLPVRMPLYIAMVAIARHIVVDANHNAYEGILLISISALVLALAVLAIRFGPLRLPYTDEGHQRDA